MTDRTVKQLHALIHKYVKKWKSELFLGMWTINFNLRDWLTNNHGDGTLTVARCDSRWAYFEADLEFSFMILKDKSNEFIERTVLHELLHIVVHEMQIEEGIEHEERVVSHLTMLIARLGDVPNKED